MWHMVPQPLEEEAAFFKQSDSHDQRLGSTFRRIRTYNIITCAAENFGGLFPELYVYFDMFLPGIELDFSRS